MTRLHREDAIGLAGLDVVLDQAGSRRDSQDIIHNWAAMVASTACSTGQEPAGWSQVAVPGADPGRDDRLEQPARVRDAGCSAERLDYVRIRDGSGPLGVKDIGSLQFNGAAHTRRDRTTGASIRTRLGRPVTRPCTRARATTATKRSCAPFLFRRAQARA